MWCKDVVWFIIILLIKLLRIISSDGFNRFVKLITNVSKEIRNKISSFGLVFHEIQPCVSTTVIYYGEEVFMTMYGSSTNRTPYVHVNMIKSIFSVRKTLRKLKLSLFSQPTIFTAFIVRIRNITIIFTYLVVWWMVEPLMP